MKGILLILALWAQTLFGISINNGRNSPSNPETEFRNSKEKKFGSVQVDLGLAKFVLLDSKWRSIYNDTYGSLGLMPYIRGAYFFHLDPFAIGLGFDLSYINTSGNTSKTPGSYTKSENKETFVYVPYQFFLDIQLLLFKDFFVTDIWVGYKESFLQNRRCDAVETKNCEEPYITEKGFHWNSYLSFGASLAFSLKWFGRERSFNRGGAFDLDNIYFKIFGEYDYNLGGSSLPFGRKKSQISMEKVKFGGAFTFKL